jgi:glycine/D-amino acid oxidase-like deaminating enzyme
MKSLFEVNGKNRFENNKKMTVSVYGIRTAEGTKYTAEFLVYYNGHWIWQNADYYTPIDNKHE